MRCIVTVAVVSLLALSSSLTAQSRTLPPAIKQYVSVDAPVIALTHARVLDGTGRPATTDQTIVIRGEKIASVGPSASATVPGDATVIDLTGKSVIPGIIGLHDHMYYGGMKFMGSSYPRLFLSAGVTTIRTTGSVDAYQELNLKRQIDSLLIPGPTIVVTGPYLQGPGPGPGAMHPLTGPDDARRMVRYWAEEGVTWFKAYTQISRADLGAAIDEAHKHGVKVTAHLCSVGFREAVSLGIDALEHGMLTNTEWYSGKQPDVCPTASSADMYGALDVESADVQKTIQEMVKHHVAMTSTLDVFELGSPSRVPFDQRVLDALYPDMSKAVAAYYERGKTQNDSSARAAFKKSMQFERAFVRAGGLLGAGSDPCCTSAIAGYGDQRNFELLIEAGFTPEQAIQVMTANGAKILGFDKNVGTIAAGMQADLVVIAGDPLGTPADIRKVETVFRRGLGYDSAKLRESIKGLVGLR
ncbi:MAG: amidohydrolase family protein [Gemmatimonadota bacterium]|nr:amidohydrolase family protein [Gemmatimonadota bacterium]